MDTADALALLAACLSEHHVTVVRGVDKLTAGSTGHVVTYDGWLYQVDGGPSFHEARDAAEAIASFEEDHS